VPGAFEEQHRPLQHVDQVGLAVLLGVGLGLDEIFEHQSRIPGAFVFLIGDDQRRGDHGVVDRGGVATDPAVHGSTGGQIGQEHRQRAGYCLDQWLLLGVGDVGEHRFRTGEAARHIVERKREVAGREGDRQRDALVVRTLQGDHYVTHDTACFTSL
jgi:hypothetical protein